MKKALRRRIVLGAMAAFIMVALLMIGSMVALIYYQQDQLSDTFLNTVLADDRSPVQSPPPDLFGYRFSQPSFPAGFYVVETDAQGGILAVEKTGILQNDEQNLQTLAVQIVQAGTARGKMGAFRYALDMDAAGARIVLLDQTMQITALYNVIKTGVIVALLAMLALAAILWPIAGRVAEQWLRGAEQQKQFITNAGHALKTPVAIIMANADAQALTGGDNKYSRNIRTQAQQLDRLIRHLMTMARADELSVGEQVEQLDLTQLLHDVLEGFSQDLQARSMAVNMDAAEPACMARGYRESLRQLVCALLDNAIKYGRAGSTVDISLCRAGKHVRLRISNAVEALPQQAPQRLLERFCRGDAARQQGIAGSGVGLSAVQAIARLHHGKCEIAYPDAHTFCVTVSIKA